MMVAATAGRWTVPDVTVQSPRVGAGGGSGKVVVVLVAGALVVGATGVDGRSLPLVDEPRWLDVLAPDAVVGEAWEHEALSRPASDTIATMDSRGRPPAFRRCDLAMAADLGARRTCSGRRAVMIWPSSQSRLAQWGWGEMPSSDWGAQHSSHAEPAFTMQRSVGEWR